jgi:chloride channel 7
MYISISLMYALVAGGLVSFVEPLAAGSGIAEVKTYLNGVHIRGLLAVRAPPAASAGLRMAAAGPRPRPA